MQTTKVFLNSLSDASLRADGLEHVFIIILCFSTKTFHNSDADVAFRVCLHLYGMHFKNKQPSIVLRWGQQFLFG